MSMLSKLEFGCGEIAPQYQARVDTALARSGLKTCRNMIFTKAHGFQNRPGTERIGDAPCDNTALGVARTNTLIPFRVTPTLDYLLELGNKTARVIVDGKYVRDLSLSIMAIGTYQPTIVVGPSGTIATENRQWKITCSTDVEAAGFAEGDLVHIEMYMGPDVAMGLDGRWVKVASVDGTYLYVEPGEGFSPTADIVSTDARGSAQRIYQFDTPWADTELDDLQYSQPDEPGDTMWFTNGSQGLYKLTRYLDTSWSAIPQPIEPTAQTPINLAFVGGPTAGVAKRYVVTSVDKDLVESLPQEDAAIIGVATAPTASTPVELVWEAVTGAKFYNIYASMQGREFGLIGRCDGVSGFKDDGVDPDVTQTPPRENDPFTTTTKELKSLGGFDPSPVGATCMARSPDGLSVAFGCDSAPYLYFFHRLTLDSPWKNVVVDTTMPYLFYAQTEGNNIEANGLYYLRMNVPLNGAVKDLAFHPGGKWLAIAGDFTGAQIADTWSADPAYALKSNVAGNYGRVFQIKPSASTPYVSVGNCNMSDAPVVSAAEAAGTASAIRAALYVVYVAYKATGTPIPAWVDSFRYLHTNFVLTGTWYSDVNLHSNWNLTLSAAAKSVCWSSNGNHLIFGSGDTQTVKMYKWLACPQSVNANYGLWHYAWVNIAFDPGNPTGTVQKLRYVPNASKLVVLCSGVGTYTMNVYNNTADAYEAVAGEPDTQPTVLPSRLACRPQGDVVSMTSETTPYLEWWLIDEDNVTKQVTPAGLAQACYSNAWSPDGEYLAVFRAVDGDGVGITFFEYDSDAKTLTAWTEQDDMSIFQSAMKDGDWTSDGSQMILVTGGSTEIGGYGYTEVRDFPKVITHGHGRMILGNLSKSKASLYGSVVNDYGNFSDRLVAQATDSFGIKLAGQNSEIRRAVLFGHYLVALCTGAENCIAWPNDGAITATDIPSVRPQTRYGSGTVAPVVHGSSLIYASGSDIRELRYDLNVQSYDGPALNQYARHLFRGKNIVAMALQRLPEPCIWVILDDGDARYFKYDREDNVIFWGSIDTDGEFQDVAVARNGLVDEVFFLVDRTVNGQEVRFTEKMNDRQYETFETDAAFLDCAKVYDGRNTEGYSVTLADVEGSWAAGKILKLSCTEDVFSSDDVGSKMVFEYSGGTFEVTISAVFQAGHGSTLLNAFGTSTVAAPTDLQDATTTLWEKRVKTVSGLAYLEGETVAVFADGYVVKSPLNPDYTEDLVVADGRVDLDDCYLVIRVGLPYLSDVETLAVNDVQNPTIMEKRKNMNRLVSQVEECRGFWVGHQAPDSNAASDLTAARFQKTAGKDAVTLFDTPASVEAAAGAIQPHTGVTICNLSGEYEDHGRVFIRHTDPTPIAFTSLHPAGVIG